LTFTGKWDSILNNSAQQNTIITDETQKQTANQIFTDVLLLSEQLKLQLTTSALIIFIPMYCTVYTTYQLFQNVPANMQPSSGITHKGHVYFKIYSAVKE
jgi:hypothetical protein